MRNLKRALSLTLASVMLLGMMVVGSSAAAGYDDVADTDNVEAIEVLQAVEVMVGDERGFGPERPVNRAEMAVVMGKLLNLDYNYYEATCPFNDVYDWARGWVGACYANGIVSGRGEGVYDPGTTVTAVEAASMLMRALGYFKYQSDYANGFEVATVSQATKIRLFDGVDSSTNAPLTRNQVAQMVLNALKSGVVEPDGNALNFIDANGNVIATGGKVNYVYTTSTKAFASAISRTTATSIGSSNDGWIVELGEQLYNGSLELRDYEQDVFGRPARTWVLDGSEIGTYVKRELLVAGGTYTEAVKGSTVYTLLGQTTIRDNDLLTYLDGANNTNITKNHLQRSNNADLYGTGRGVLTEVYLDNDHDEITIASINTWLAKATMDYNTNSESITLTVYDSRMGGTISKVVDLEDAPYIEGMKKDDWCLVQWYGDSLTGHTDRTVVEAFDVEIVENQALTAFKRTEAEKKDNYDENEDTYVSELTTGGETYKANAQAWYKYETLNDFDASAMVNKTYTVFMDQYGNFIGVELYSGSDQYVFITGYDRNSSNISVNTATAAGIFTDGTMAAITVNVKDTNKNIDTWNEKNTRNGQSGRWEDTYEEWTFRPGANLGWDGKNQENMWYKYTLNNNVYTLTPVDGYTKNVSTVSPEREVNSSKVYLAFNEGVNSFGTGNSYGEDASIYITVDNDDVDTTEGRKDAITEVTGVYTGAQSVNLVVPEGQWIHSVWKDNYIVAAIVWGEAEGSVDNYAYIRSGVNKEWIETDNNGSVTHFWDFDAVMNGEKVTKTIKSKFSNTVNDLQPGQVQELILDADGYVTRIKDVNYPINTGVTEDKLYNNEDFADSINNVGTDTLKGKDVYHVETEWTVREGRQTEDMPTLVGTSTYGDYTDLYFQGNTIHYTSNLQDLGLVVTRDAKAVVKQTINGKAEWENYSSVSAAYSILNDANSDRSGKQFCGEIAAVLDSNGRAAWVVFIDNTPTRSKDIDYGDYTYDFTRNGIKFRIDSDSSNDRNTTGTVDRFGDLTVFVPKAITRAVKNPLDVTVQVTVNGIDVGNAVYTESKDTNTFFAYVLGNWALDTSKDEIVVTVIWADDSVKDQVRITFNADGAEVTLNDTAKTPVKNGEYLPVGTEIVVTAKAGYTVNVIAGNNNVDLDPGEKAECTVGNTGLRITVKEINDDDLIKRPVNVLGTWFYFYYDKDGKFVKQEKLDYDPTIAGMALMARAATIPGDVTLIDGAKYQGKLGDFIITFTYYNEVLDIVDIDIAEGVENPSMGTPETSESGVEYYAIKQENTDEVPALKTVTATAAAAGNAVNDIKLTLGQPDAIGAKLPTTLDVDGNVTAKITWAPADAIDADGCATKADGYTYTVELVPAAGKTFSTAVKVNDKTPAGTVTADGKITVDGDTVTAGPTTPAGTKVTLTLTGALGAVDATTGLPKVWENNKAVAAGTPEVTRDENGNAVTSTPYSVTSGSTVIIDMPAGLNIAEGAYEVGADKVTVKVKGNTITFTMPEKAFTLDVDAGKLDGATEVKIVTVNGGVEGTWALAASGTASAQEGTLEQGENSVPKGAKITLTSNGTGKYVMQATTVAGTVTSVADQTNLWDGKATTLADRQIDVNSDLTLYAASLVTIKARSNIIAEGKVGKTDISLTDAATNGTWVPVDTDLELRNTTGAYAGYLTEAESGKAIANDTYKVAGSDAVTISGGYTVTLGEGLSANFGGTAAADATKTFVKGNLVASGVYVAIVSDGTKGFSVIDTPRGVSYTASAHTNGTISANVDVTGATRIDFPATGVEIWSEVNGTLAKCEDGTGSAIASTIYVLDGTKIQVRPTNPGAGVPFATSEGKDVGEVVEGGLNITVGTKPISVILASGGAVVASSMEDALALLKNQAVTGVTLNVPAGQTATLGDLNLYKTFTINGDVKISGNVVVGASGDLKVKNLTKADNGSTITVKASGKLSQTEDKTISDNLTVTVEASGVFNTNTSTAYLGTGGYLVATGTGTVSLKGVVITVTGTVETKAAEVKINRRNTVVLAADAVLKVVSGGSLTGDDGRTVNDPKQSTIIVGVGAKIVDNAGTAIGGNFYPATGDGTLSAVAGVDALSGKTIKWDANADNNGTAGWKIQAQ